MQYYIKQPTHLPINGTLADPGGNKGCIVNGLGVDDEDGWDRTGEFDGDDNLPNEDIFLVGSKNPPEK